MDPEDLALAGLDSVEAVGVCSRCHGLVEEHDGGGFQCYCGSFAGWQSSWRVQ